jgi:hypothetical protein
MAKQTPGKIPPTPARVIQAYLKINEETKKKLTPLQKIQDNRSNWLLKHLNDNESNSVPTDYGTAFKKKSEYISCENFEEMMEEYIFKPVAEYLKEYFSVLDGNDIPDIEEGVRKAFTHARFDLFTKAVSKDTVLSMMGKADNKGSRPNPPPKGIKYSSEIKLHVNSPTKKRTKEDQEE